MRGLVAHGRDVEERPVKVTLGRDSATCGSYLRSRLPSSCIMADDHYDDVVDAQRAYLGHNDPNARLGLRYEYSRCFGRGTAKNFTEASLAGDMEVKAIRHRAARNHPSV